MRFRQTNILTLSAAALSFSVAVVITSCSDATSPSPPAPAPPTLSEQLNDILSDTLPSFGGTGVSAAVLMPGGQRWVGASGISHEAVSTTPQMLFGASSTTKTYTAALALKLAEAGFFTLEDSLHQWLANYQHVDSNITIRQLLSHTSGVYDFISFPGAWDSIMHDPTRVWTPDEVLTSLVDVPISVPGVELHYSNTGFLLVGMVIEASTGSTVSSELRSRLLGPLGLTNTFFDHEESITGEIAHAWFPAGGSQLVDISSVPRTAASSATWTAGAVFTTAEELAEWARTLYGGQALDEASLAEMVLDPGSGYGLGADLELGPLFAGGERAVGHIGSGRGYSAVLTYLPDYDVAVGVMMNDNNLQCLFAITSGLVATALDDLS